MKTTFAEFKRKPHAVPRGYFDSQDESDFWRGLGAVMRGLREGSGMTQEQLASAMGLSRGQVANMELGRSRISAFQIRTLCYLFRKQPGDLFRVK